MINVSGHRIGTAEVESALVAHKHVAESAVVGYNHPIKGQGIWAFVTLKEVSNLVDAECFIPYSDAIRGTAANSLY